MPRRTFGEARAVLDTLVLSPDDRKEREKLLKQKINKELAALHTRQKEQHQTLEATIKELKSDLSEVEQKLYDLEKDSRAHDISAHEYRQRFDQLQQQRAGLMQKSLATMAQADRYADIEEDPESYLDDMYRRFPTVKPEFPW